MPRMHKVDRPVTRMMLREGYFKDKRSFVSLPGDDGESHLFLKGPDMSAQRERAIDRDKGICKLCETGDSKLFVDPRYVEVHHIIHRGKGGSDDLANLVTSCPECHRSKHVRVKWGPRRKQAAKDFKEVHGESN